MSLTCTRCEGSGFLNLIDVGVPDELDLDDPEAVEAFLAEHDDSDISVCDCCGDGEAGWYGVPGEHYGPDDPGGHEGPYASNGGLAGCH